MVRRSVRSPGSRRGGSGPPASPVNRGCRSCPSPVHSVKSTCTTSSGAHPAHVPFPGASRSNGPVVVRRPASRRPSPASVAWSKPVPTRPAVTCWAARSGPRWRDRHRGRAHPRSAARADRVRAAHCDQVVECEQPEHEPYGREPQPRVECEPVTAAPRLAACPTNPGGPEPEEADMYYQTDSRRRPRTARDRAVTGPDRSCRRSSGPPARGSRDCRTRPGHRRASS